MQCAAVRTHSSLIRLAPHSSSCGLRLYSITCLRRASSLLHPCLCDMVAKATCFVPTMVLKPPRHHHLQRCVSLGRTPTTRPLCRPSCSSFQTGGAVHTLTGQTGDPVDVQLNQLDKYNHRKLLLVAILGPLNLQMAVLGNPKLD